MTAEGMAPGSQDDLLRALAAEPLDARAFAAPDLALLKYADKLTRAPSTIDAGDIARLRAAGFDDRAIHDACAIVAYFAFVNRTADGLGVELEGHVAGESP